MSEDIEISINQWIDSRRQHLLDLSRRNKLLNLNYKGPRKKVIQFTNGSIDKISQLLSDSSTQLILTGIPVDNKADKLSIDKAREIADSLGISTDTFLPLKQEEFSDKEIELLKQIKSKINSLSYDEKKSYILGDYNFVLDSNFPLDDTLSVIRKIAPKSKSTKAFFKGIMAERIFLDDYISKNPNKFRLNTLLSDESLMAMANKIYNDEHSLELEKGTSFLYLSLGFLKWKDNITDGNEFCSPLFSIPVKIIKNRVRGSFVFYLQKGADDVTVNLSLKEKLLHTFNVEIPDIDFDITPSEYFKKVENHLSKLMDQGKWKILPEAVLTILDFTKLVMFRDLNPSNWLGDSCLHKHPIILSLANESQNIHQTKNFTRLKSLTDLEKLSLIKNVKLVESADSSQIEAITNILDSNDSYIIQGPPGTGKSQTITNLIALALYRGKKVLFVSEKLAALDVVKHKLDAIGLGEFCLELHSDKCKKENVVASIHSSIQKCSYFSEDTRKEDEIFSLYTQFANQLTEYVNTIHSKWENTGNSVYEILNKSVRLRIENEKYANRGGLEYFLPQNYNKEVENRFSFTVNDFISQVEKVEKSLGCDIGLNQHPWFGVNVISNSPTIRQSIYDELNKWQESLIKINDELLTLYGSGIKIDSSESSFNELKDFFEKFNIDFSKVKIDLLKKNETDSGYINKLSDVLNSIITAKRLFVEINNENVLTQDCYLKLRKNSYSNFISCECLNDIRFSDDTTISELVELSNNLEQGNKLLCKYSDLINTLNEKYNNKKTKSINYTLRSAESIADLLEIVSNTPDNLIPYRNCFNKISKTVLNEIYSKLSDINNDKELIKKFIRLDDESIDLSTIKTLYENYTSGIWPFSLFSSAYRESSRKIKQISLRGRKKLFLNNYEKIKSYYSKLNALYHNNHFIINFSNFNLKDSDQDNLFNLLSLWKTWNNLLIQKFGSQFSEKFELINLLMQLSEEDFISIKDSEFDIEYSNVRKSIKYFSDLLISKRNKFKEFFSHLKKSDVDIGPEGELEKASDEINNILRNLLCIFKNENINLGCCKSFISRINKLQESYKVIDGNISFINEEILPYGVQFNSYIDEIPNLDKINESIKLSKQIESLTRIDGLKGIISSCVNAGDLKEVFSSINKIVVDYINSYKYKQSFFKEIDSESDLWGISDNKSLQCIIERNKDALTNKECLSDYIGLNISKNKMRKIGLSSYIPMALEREFPRDKLSDIVFADVYNSIANEIYSRNSLLNSVQGSQLDSYRKSFCLLDQKLLDANREAIQNKIRSYQSKVVCDPKNKIQKGTKAADRAELVLIRSEFQKKTRRIPLRQLFKRAPRSCLGLKPCFMMSPLSVANYIDPGCMHFDLLVMDEASQVKPSDALGAIARSSQFVVVGDQQQMPPSSFFDVSLDTDLEENDVDIIDEAKSILDAAVDAGFPSNMLKWHYRSRHESLISFSNKHFYQDELIVFPSPKSNTSDYGIKFKYIENGCFSNGFNNIEADIVVNAAIDHFYEHPDESLAIVAMNDKQSTRIEELLNNRILNSSEADLAWKRMKSHKEPLIIKNLESIQGDERDVVFISCTYGKDKDSGLVNNRFGPINNVGGEKRLNVLFTRARKRMVVFSSMQPEDIKSSLNKGPEILKSFLSFAKNGVEKAPVILQDKGADSDFEISVRNMLERNGFECDIQVGVQGYYIDIAVKDPNRPGEYLMGIECDGATYHSAAIARERDCLRQQILERLGWKIERIWSTDWFQNPEGTITPIIETLKKSVCLEPSSIELTLSSKF